MSRASLRAAFASRTKALKEAEAARVASGRSRALVAELAAEVARLESEDRAIAESRAQKIQAAMRAGKKPDLVESSKAPAIAAALAESRNRLAAARLAEAQLVQAEAQSDLEVAAAEAGITAAIKGVVAAAANEMAERVLDLQAEVNELQEKIGLYGYGFVLRYLEKSGSVLSQSMSGVVWGFNSPEMKNALAYARKWEAWTEALANDADAPLELDD